MLNFENDPFDGVIVSLHQATFTADVFKDALQTLLGTASAGNKKLIWLTLAIEQSHLIDVAIKLGFVFHNCLETEITLIHRIQQGAYAPFKPTHSLGAGGLVTRGNNEILVVREKTNPRFKLPGGHIELGEKIAEAVVREVLEETGVTAQFQSILGIATRHPYEFGKSNMYFVCGLIPVSDEINIQDTDEIEEARWIAVSDYLEDENNSLFNRQIVNAAWNRRGLLGVELEGNEGKFKKHEVFLVE
ncbi:NUDIX domain-containing protein [Hahella sp. CCB-MM4]|uniref:NUDIX hydrolase n=1 Tax=Hahella sp. (strain CCB-MM4) TaxID=1926491 RepID=UPI000B9A2284|nr:NUDIX domain-containing protein [Hahella sp. CCB-MM4]